MRHMPDWLAGLPDDDIAFIRNFVVSSGSIKHMARLYQVSYPTMRIRLDRLIQKIELSSGEEDPFITLVKNLAIDERYDIETARILLEEYRKTQEGHS